MPPLGSLRKLFQIFVISALVLPQNFLQFLLRTSVMRKLGLNKLPAKHAVIALLGMKIQRARHHRAVAYEFAVKIFSHALPQFSVYQTDFKANIWNVRYLVSSFCVVFFVHTELRKFCAWGKRRLNILVANKKRRADRPAYYIRKQYMRLVD